MFLPISESSDESSSSSESLSTEEDVSSMSRSREIEKISSEAFHSVEPVNAELALRQGVGNSYIGSEELDDGDDGEEEEEEEEYSEMSMR